MPRNEGFLDPGAGPVASFAWDLRALREKAGKAPYRVLAKRAGFCASTLSVAASGAKLPSLDVTLAYVQACGGDPETWRVRWHELAAEHLPAQPGPNAQPEPGLQVAPPYDADERDEPAQSAAESLRLPVESSQSADRELAVVGSRVIAAEHDGARPESATWTAPLPPPSSHGGLNGNPVRRSRLRAAQLSRVVTIALALATTALGLKVFASGSTTDAPPTSPPVVSASPADTAMQQADALYTLIYQAPPWRSGASDAIWDVDSCRNLSNAQSKLRTFASRRHAQVEQLATMKVSKIPGYAGLVKALTDAWLTSAQSDTAYANIAADLQTGCTSGAFKTDPNYQQADSYAQAASAAKAEAARLWNDNADALGQVSIFEYEL